jgi:hypothetical protein
MSQDPDSRKDHKSPESLLEEAKAHFNRVITIDPGNCVAHIFLDQVYSVETPQVWRHQLTPRTASDYLDPKTPTDGSGPRSERGRNLKLDAGLSHWKCAEAD